MNLPYGVTVTVERRAKRDRVGDRVASPVPHQIPGCAIAPETGSSAASSSTDSDAQRATVVSWRYLYCPAGADIQIDDAVTLPNGRTYLVEGEPAEWISPFTSWHPGIVVRLRGAF